MGRLAATALLVLAWFALPLRAQEPGTLVGPGPRDRCPVCGMLVARFPEWWAQVEFADGGRVTFDGVKDLVRYLGDPGSYTPGRTAAAVARAWVRDYYSLEPLAAGAAFYVAGSDVLGPMGREFIPLRSRPEAEEFTRDHRGTAILRFEDLPSHPLQ